jgi:GT2 family glycosyltransferase
MSESHPARQSPDAPAITGAATVGAVVVNFNSGNRVLRTVSALLAQTWPLTDIVVVDNASTDGSAARLIAVYPQVRLLAQADNYGLPRARNIGLAALDTSHALIIDHDIYADERCVEEMLRAWQAEQPAVICPRIRLLPDRDVVQVEGASPHFLGTLVLRHGYTAVRRAPAEACQVDGCTGGCMLVDRRRVIAAGGFDESFFFYLEDLEFSLRLRALGHRFWCQPTAEVFHELAQGTPGLAFRGHGSYPARRAFYTMRNRLQVILIHYRARTLLVLSPVLALYELASLVAAVSKCWPGEWLRAWGWQFRHRRSLCDRRHRMQRSRSVADRDLLVGGTPPLAPGFVTNGWQAQLLRAFSWVVNGYWSLARRWIG